MAMPLAEPARPRCCPPRLPELGPPGSRRRRLWELDASAHCPVLGVCLPIDALRRLAGKALPQHDGDDDYRLHCLAVAEAKRRGALSELLHKELERRFAQPLRQAATLKTRDALAAWWQAHRAGEHMPGALWSVLTHARCDTVLETQVLADVHMLQHQCGAAQRVDQARFEALQAENAMLRQQLTELRQRLQQQGTGLQQQLERLQSELMRRRAEAIGRETALLALRDELQQLQAQVPGLKARSELARQLQRQSERIAQLERALMRARQLAERDDAGVPMREPAQATASDAAAASVAPPTALPVLGDRAVLCVGGRPASVPLYRHIVERSGGRFLHHDGGDEHNVQRLDATLSAADLVICQAGCVSHDAYWRVKDHCKRHGKRCVFVDNPGSASLRRALAALQA